MTWNLDKIRADMESRIPSDPEAQMAMLVDLMVASYPIHVVLSSLLNPGPRGSIYESKLFPDRNEDGAIELFDAVTREIVTIEEETGFTAVDYDRATSIELYPSEILRDDFVVLEGNAEFAGGSAYTGPITIAEVKRMAAWFADNPRVISASD